jgi:hypothetical protein
MSKHVIQWIVAALAVTFVWMPGGSALANSAGPPAITSITPTSAEPGSTVTINGTNLDGASVTFQKPHSVLQPVTATAAETLVSPDGTRILLTIPDGSDAANGLIAAPGMNQLVVTTPGGKTTTTFKVLEPGKVGMAPVISRLVPRTARPGATVTITGSHLSGAETVRLAGMKAKFKVPSDSMIVAVVPRHAKSGRWSVTTPVGTTSSSLRFEIVTSSV